MKPDKKKQTGKGTKFSIDYDLILYGLIIVAYILIPTFTPNLGALDTNAPKFLSTAFLNVIVFFLLILTQNDEKNKVFGGQFFKSNIGKIYTAFLAIVLLSFVKSNNITESILQLSKVLTVFAAVFNLSIIINRDLRYLKFIAITMTGLLLFDAFSVFYYINKFIDGEIVSILNIKTVYSNKNILASAIFVKLPFALWLLIFEKGWYKKIAWFTLTAGIAATFFLATRAFYLGLFVISIIFIGYYSIQYLQSKKKEFAWLSGIYLASILVALVFFSLVQNFLYPGSRAKSQTEQGAVLPTNTERHTQGVLSQVTSISETDGSTSLRLDAWRWSWQLIKENPLLGVGTGNWKVAILKLENQKNEAFIYIYKAHNDFIETTTETGIIGGLLFLSIFGFVFWNFTQYYRKNQDFNGILLRAFYLSAAGLLFYAVDAFFNFPADRPEILILFAIYVATGIVSVNHFRQQELLQKNGDDFGRLQNSKLINWLLGIISIGLMFSMIYIFYLNFLSIKTQRIAFQEILAGKLVSPSETIIAGFPILPNVSIWGEPISSIKARYLIDEKKYQEAIKCVESDNSSPYDARREFYLATAYRSLNLPDSALYFSKLTYQLKPNYLRNIVVMAELLEQKQEYAEACSYFEIYFKKNKPVHQAYVMASNLYIKNNEFDKAILLIDKALEYFPNDTSINKQQRFLSYKKNVDPYIGLFNEAKIQFEDKNYPKCLKLITEFLEKVPNDNNGLITQAFSYYYLKRYDECIESINKSLSYNEKNASLINLRGVCYRSQNKNEKACDDFKRAKEMGNQSGITNYSRYCGSK